MPPRLLTSARYIHRLTRPVLRIPANAHYATAEVAVPAPDEAGFYASEPLKRYPSLQPPSHKSPDARRSQLHRQYTSLLKSTPLMLVFQHNNLNTQEWLAVRRELTGALRKIDQDMVEKGHGDVIADHVKMQVIQSGVFGAALRVVEYFQPSSSSQITSDDPRVASSLPTAAAPGNGGGSAFQHSLSRTAHAATFEKRSAHPLEPLLSGPVAILTFPTISTAHLKAALSILAPSPPDFPAPTRRSNPGWHEPHVQSGLQKLLLLGARVEGSVFGSEKARWMGTIPGGIDGLRAQLVSTLQGAGAAITTSLEAATRSIYFTLEGRKGMLEEEANDSSET